MASDKPVCGCMSLPVLAGKVRIPAAMRCAGWQQMGTAPLAAAGTAAAAAAPEQAALDVLCAQSARHDPAPAPQIWIAYGPGSFAHRFCVSQYQLSRGNAQSAEPLPQSHHHTATGSACSLYAEIRLSSPLRLTLLSLGSLQAAGSQAAACRQTAQPSAAAAASAGAVEPQPLARAELCSGSAALSCTSITLMVKIPEIEPLRSCAACQARLR